MFVLNWIEAQRKVTGLFGFGAPTDAARKDTARNLDLPWIRATVVRPSHSQTQVPQQTSLVTAVRKAVTPFLVENTTQGRPSVERLSPQHESSSARHQLASRAALRVIRVVDATPATLQAANDSPSNRLAGRMRLSGRACDVRAELERMAA